ncbi:ABC-type antimicrobial peptide transport system permease subunit [Kitasatospora sp. MAP12-15]|uniref:ABC transporter permease n=1 Tax=unclassified Kitasatospora TaxID=2633591 RepID=UPI002473D856|nr:FtsX-like permease family protein [Kitasatospora sp. MAP12-44]MDH6115067.1 ABC-type antimicrobial peptide transport system permease subunit [Kitasatospora sp. MAP12-44]
MTGHPDRPGSRPGSRPPVGRPSPTRWAGDLLLGLRLAVTGGWDGVVRTLLTAVSVGLGVAMLLLASSFPVMKHHRDDRIHAIADMLFADGAPRSDHSLLITDLSTTYHGRAVRGRAVQPEGPAAPLPPGLNAYPAPGQLLVSPALADLLRSPDGRLLQERIGRPIAGRIGNAGLVGPGDYAFYLGSDQLAGDPTALRLDHFGGDLPKTPIPPLLVFLSVAGVVILLTPVAVFLAAGVRFGGEARDRRLAALRLVGADQASTARIAAGESLAGALVGLALGAVFFLVGARLIELITIAGISVFAVDVVPDPLIAVPALLAVLVLAVVVTLATMRRISVEPLGVVRAGRARKRRLWWRVALSLLGTALLLSRSSSVQGLDDQTGIAVVIAGLMLLLIGATTLLPSLLELAVRGLGDGPPSWQLAVRRIQFSIETAARPTSGIVVAVAGAIALQALLGGMTGEYSFGGGSASDRGDSAMVQVDFTAGADQAARDADAFRGSAAVATVAGYTELDVQSLARPDAGTRVEVADCRTLQVLSDVADCADGDAFATAPAGAGGSAMAGGASAVAAGGSVVADVQVGETVIPRTFPPTTSGPRWRIPAARATVHLKPAILPQVLVGTLLVTPSAVPAALLGGLHPTVRLLPAPREPDAEEQILNTAARIDVHAMAYHPYAAQLDSTFSSIERALTAAVVAMLTLIGASMLVGLLEQLRDRKRTLAVLTAFGTRRRTLAWAVLWQSMLPVLVGLVLAVAAGLALGGLLLKLAHLPIAFDWAEILRMAAAGGVAVLTVTALSLPMLWRNTRAVGLRYE